MSSKHNNMKNSVQMKVLLMLNDLSLRGRWEELRFGLKLLNKILTRFYIKPYWKYVLQLLSLDDMSKVMDTIPQFIE